MSKIYRGENLNQACKLSYCSWPAAKLPIVRIVNAEKKDVAFFWWLILKWTDCSCETVQLLEITRKTNQSYEHCFGDCTHTLFGKSGFNVGNVVKSGRQIKRSFLLPSKSHWWNCNGSLWSVWLISLRFLKINKYKFICWLKERLSSQKRIFLRFSEKIIPVKGEFGDKHQI